MTRGATARSGPVVVVGGANLDIKARTAAPLVPRTSNPGRSYTSPGGVGRNIAENLARLGTPVELVAPIGSDALGAGLRAETAAAGVGLTHLLPAAATGTYLAVLDHDGELAVAVASMAATDAIRPADLEPVADLVGTAAVLVIDGNVPAAACGWLLDRAAAAGVPVVLDPVSVAKAAPLATLLSPDRPVLALTPNSDELASILGCAASELSELAAVAGAAARLHDRGVVHVWVRRGAQGSLLSSRSGGRTTAHQIPAPSVDVVEVTGAGDAATAALVHALHTGRSPVDAARFGQAAAAVTVATVHTVRPDLTTDLLRSIITIANPVLPPANAS